MSRATRRSVDTMGESREYMTLPEENGSINIAEEVIAAIAVGAVRDVEGVSGMMSGMGGSVTDLMNKKNAQKGTRGVKIDMTGATLTLDIYLTVAYGHPIPEVAENAQKAVVSSVEAMTGCPVGTVNIHVDGVTLA
ncbi:Asp23/Gls24 family envelope stress response protein [Oscillibacter sp.]|uniref:Asp23/Gls24 family envelope stress response protein n=1 Tax=Oscillibacter sp. TaxID=1945593 RepID=UPI003391D5C7